ncbi:MAG: hypothetical protein LM590_08900 [Thermofilum sp.]|nr:hypothetical protein [Thermofilum sp.]
MLSPSGLASIAPACIDGSAVRAAYKRALRTGLYWRLSPEERAILRLSCSFSLIKSPTLVPILFRIISQVLPSLAVKAQALALGLKVVEERVRQALSLGYYQALEWLKDISLAVRVGLSLLNTPKAYWPEVT